MKIRSVGAVIAVAVMAISLAGCDVVVNSEAGGAKEITDDMKSEESLSDSAEGDTLEGDAANDNRSNENASKDTDAEDVISQDKDINITSEPVHVYYEGTQSSDDEDINMYFVNGNKQIPYYDMETVQHILMKIYNEGYGDYEKDPIYALKYYSDGNKVTFERESTYEMTIDFDEDTIYFYDFDMFISHSYDVTTVDLSHTSGYDEEGKPIYLKRIADRSTARYGKDITVDPGSYGIDLIEKDGEFYIPAQTMADLLITSTYTRYIYNGVDAFYINDTNLQTDLYEGTGVGPLIYPAVKEQRSQELIDYTYNELCMVLDYEYGLKEIHDIENFDLYFQELSFEGKSLKELLMSDDPVEMEQGIKYLTDRGFDDLHSTYKFPGAYAGVDSIAETTKVEAGPMNELHRKVLSDFKFARRMGLMDENYEIPAYQEIGNTAYITFDFFTPASMDYYSNPPTEDSIADTVGLIIYADSQIKRLGSPIENIVIDLSCNTGGYEDAVAFVCAWFLGDAQIFLKNPLTGASSINVYECDANLDHVFDENDNVSDYNLYCIISPGSFSCANLAPCMFDCSQQVTLIGQTTGGGSCVTLPLTTASGSVFQVSGYRVISSMKNGSFYNSGQGIDPDVVITKTENFYDRQALTDMINSML